MHSNHREQQRMEGRGGERNGGEREKRGMEGRGEEKKGMEGRKKEWLWIIINKSNMITKAQVSQGCVRTVCYCFYSKQCKLTMY